MSSIVRPTGPQQTRRLVVLAATVFSIAAGQIQQMGGFGQTPAEFAADSDATLRVVGYAFAIWGVIYLWLSAYAIRQVLPATGESDMIRRFALPSIVAMIFIGLWNFAAAFDQEVATIVIISTALLALLIPLLRHGALIRSLSRGDRDRWLVAWPLALLAGWLTVATPVNIVTVATGNGDLPTFLSPTAWALVAVLIVVLIGVLVTWRTRLLAYSLPIVWGLAGVVVAEQARNPVLAYVTAFEAALLLIVAIVLVFRVKPGVERARV
ncbi:hypothetical protein [Brevundimonas variabilis]|uniref:Tryptophan-rich sensory protein n=1 Tax=Brevundimonas variabilis TaxID=74312 RepID=A0A7W9FGR3_9CAUL|nr:hypothetical protein [Brevundimonas variabilis]MBB5746923.1 hypothetical protein [Brevundimonas variabilis]